MNKIEESFEGFIQGREETLGILEETTGVKDINKDKKSLIKKYILLNPDNLFTCLVISKNIESQIALITLVTRLFTKEEITLNKILKEHSENLTLVPRNNKNKILNFLNKAPDHRLRQC